MRTHTCDAVIVTCIDFRFQNHIQKWIATHLAGKTYDRISLAGSTKNLDEILGQINISVKLHRIHQAILINHEDCGAYGKESTSQRHAQDLKKAKEVVLTHHPDLHVSLYYLYLDGTFEEVK